MTNTEKARLVIQQVEHVILGKNQCVSKIMAALLARGHILIEDIPGVGKTTLAVAFGRSMGLDQKRVQFTPDVLPTDITGFTMYQKQSDRFVYQPGAVLCNLFLADEINRTSTRTQSALLEVMEENAVTVDGVSHPVPQPFHVIATQNPVGSAGTQLLPDSQLDRFLISIRLGYPDKASELEMLEQQAVNRPLDSIAAVMTREELLEMQQEVRQVFIHPAVYEYIVELSRATRQREELELGLSPRGTLAIAAMARAQAYIKGRSYVTPADVAEVFPEVARHRLKLVAQSDDTARVEGIIAQLLAEVEKPRPERVNKG